MDIILKVENLKFSLKKATLEKRTILHYLTETTIIITTITTDKDKKRDKRALKIAEIALKKKKEEDLKLQKENKNVIKEIIV